MACGLWLVVYGLWFMVCGLWYVVYGYGGGSLIIVLLPIQEFNGWLCKKAKSVSSCTMTSSAQCD